MMNEGLLKMWLALAKETANESFREFPAHLLNKHYENGYYMIDNVRQSDLQMKSIGIGFKFH